MLSKAKATYIRRGNADQITQHGEVNHLNNAKDSAGTHSKKRRRN